DELLLALEDREALGVGLHHSVLDAVVDHLGVVAGAAGPDARPALVRRRRQRREQWRQASRRIGFAADHQAVALGQAPDAATGADIEIDDARLRQRGRAALAVLVERV